MHQINNIFDAINKNNCIIYLEIERCLYNETNLYPHALSICSSVKASVTFMYLSKTASFLMFAIFLMAFGSIPKSKELVINVFLAVLLDMNLYLKNIYKILS